MTEEKLSPWKRFEIRWTKMMRDAGYHEAVRAYFDRKRTWEDGLNSELDFGHEWVDDEEMKENE